MALLKTFESYASRASEAHFADRFPLLHQPALLAMLEPGVQHLTMRSPSKLPQPTLTADGTAVTLPRTLTPTGVARVLGCSPVYVRSLLRCGRLKGFRLAGEGSPWRVLRTDFLSYLNQQKRAAVAGSESPETDLGTEAVA